jgi:hypothetical protein
LDISHPICLTFQCRVAGDLTTDIAEYAAQIAAQLFERAAHPAELPGMGVVLFGLIP